MPLTKLQFRYLRFYQRLHEQPPTLLRFLWLGRLNWLMLLPCVAYGAWVAFYFDPPFNVWGYFVMGMSVGALLRDLGRTIASVRVWPLMERIVDWRRVEELANSPDDAPSA